MRAFIESSIWFAIVFVFLCLCGCTTRTKYVEGTMTQVGLYIPIESNIYGVQMLNYLNGCSITASSNQTLTVEREFSSTNTYFGVITTVESSKTKAEVK